MKKEETKNIIILDGEAIIQEIVSKYGSQPIFSSKYEEVKNLHFSRLQKNIKV